MSKRVEFLREKYSKIQKEKFDELVIVDPTSDKKYLDWLCRIFNKNKLQQSEFSSATNLISCFESVKDFLPTNLKDLNSFNSLIEASIKINSFLSSHTKKLNKESSFINKGAFLLYEDYSCLITKVFSLEGSKNFGSNTSWCTLYPDKFYEYIKKDYLYIIDFRVAGSKIQCSFAKNEFRENKNNSIDFIEILKQYPIVYETLKKDSDVLKNSFGLIWSIMTGNFSTNIEIIKQKIVSGDSWILQYANSISPTLLSFVLKRNKSDFKWIKNKEKFINTYISSRENGLKELIDDYPEIKLSEENLQTAIAYNKNNFKFIKSPTKENWKTFISSYPEEFKNCPYKNDENFTAEVIAKNYKIGLSTPKLMSFSEKNRIIIAETFLLNKELSSIERLGEFNEENQLKLVKIDYNVIDFLINPSQKSIDESELQKIEESNKKSFFDLEYAYDDILLKFKEFTSNKKGKTFKKIVDDIYGPNDNFKPTIYRNKIIWDSLPSDYECDINDL